MIFVVKVAATRAKNGEKAEAKATAPAEEPRQNPKAKGGEGRGPKRKPEQDEDRERKRKAEVVEMKPSKQAAARSAQPAGRRRRTRLSRRFLPRRRRAGSLASSA